MKSLLAGCFLLLSIFCLAQTPPLSPGTLYYTSSNLAFPYNQPITGIGAVDATGGNCSSYIYTWEQSVEEGPWTLVGPGANPPSFPALIGNTRIRRSVSCGNEQLYTNVLSIVPVYVSIDYENRNYVREVTVTKKGVLNWYAADQLPIGNKFQTTTYLDGLGRTVQTVSKGISSSQANTWNDIVKHYEYDAAGRALKDFLSYSSATNPGKFKPNAGGEQTTATQSLYGEPATAATYTLSETDNSPLNRITKVTPPGQGLTGAGVSTDIDFNTETGDKVRIWMLDYTVGAGPKLAGFYGDGTLLKTVTTQDGRQVVTYTDRNGSLILKKVQLSAAAPTALYADWICTYNVYDDFGRLCYQLQPEAVKYLDEHNWAFDIEGKVLNGLCFQYRYDAKGRNTWKKAPGAEPLQMIYDERDRLVFTQDGNQAAKATKECTATIYDELNRPVITTIYRPGKTLEQLQTDVDDAVSTTITITNPVWAQPDLVVDYRDQNITQYKARNSIEFISEFQSTTGDEFTAEIDPGATTPATVVATVVHKNPITSANLNNPSVCTILKYQFYDSYSFPDAKPFDTRFDNAAAYSNSDPDVQAIATTARTTGFATGSKVRVLGTNLFFNSTSYYDERGNLIQTLEDNIKSGKDVTTVQYHFNGRVLSTHSKHSTANTGYSNFSVLTKNTYDQIGRLTGIGKQINNASSFKNIVTYGYDELGRVKTKNIDPDYTRPTGEQGMETQAYSYNIVGNLTGINKDYALKKAGTYSKWKNFFGFYLGYDNLDGVFANPNKQGQVTGQLWTTQGDDAQRKYDYVYDNAGRLTKADFKERATTSETWNTNKLDFSIGGDDAGKIRYDRNGNLKSMIQMGFYLASTTPVEVDNLNYEYFEWSNQLRKVTDLTTLGQANGKVGDFKDGTNDTYRDYVYDANGNLIVDYNKDAYAVVASSFDYWTPAPAGATPAIKYNFLDKPEEITIVGKGVIKFVYDAEGNKLQKIFTAAGTSTAVTTSYVNGYVYKGDELQYIGFEEGCIRVMQDVAQNNGYDYVTVAGNIALPNGKKGVYDYYLRDYQQNVRMILTEETHTGSNVCTMETGTRATQEEPLFGQSGSANEVSSTRFPAGSIPGGWSNPGIGNSVSKLSNLTKKNGPNVFLKVMAGDELSASSLFYFKPGMTSGTGGGRVLNDVLSSIMSAMMGSPALGATEQEGGMATQALNTVDPFKAMVSPHATETGPQVPKAYLTVLFFDERMRYVEEGSTFLRVNAQDNGQNPLALQNIKAPKNGYCYAYLSNESDEPVYFDGFRVTLNRGRIIEENHYYAYGLKIAALSSCKLGDETEGKLDNQHLYNGQELQEDADLDWYDYGLRNYDVQIGRWVNIDPYSQHPSPYVGMGGDPVNRTDPDGGWDWFQNSQGDIINLVGNHDATACLDGIEYQNIGASLDYVVTRNVAGVSFQQKIGSMISADNGPVGGIWQPVDDIDFLMSSPNIFQTVIKSDGLGMAYIGKEKEVNAKVFYARDETVGESIRGGLGGAVGYKLGGDKGAVAGSVFFDQAAMAMAALPKPNFETVPYDNPPRAYDNATGPSGATEAAETISPNVQNVLKTLNDFKAQGGTVKLNPLSPTQEINLTFQEGSRKLDFRIETHPLPPKFGGDGVTPQRHMNVDLYPNKKVLPNSGHKIL